MAPALHHGEPSRGGVPAKGSAIGIVAPVVAPREMASLQGKRLVCLDFGTTSVLSKRLGVSCVTN